jgi:hypothetical protein
MRAKVTKTKERVTNKLNYLVGRLMLALGLRPSSFPYLSGDGFRTLAHHRYDETGKCQAADIKEEQRVFVKSDLINEWFEQVHPRIAYPYVLLTHNSDRNIGEADLRFIDDKIIRWYAQNAKTKHPKLTPLPLGLNNLYLNYAEKPRLFNKLKKEHPVRKNRITFAFSISTNPAERQPAYDALKRSPVADDPVWINDREKYLRSIMNYKFVGAPDGNGNDDPRRWQAMYVGVVPIVKRTASMEYFRGLGLPLHLIESWDEVAQWDESDLAAIYEKLKPGFGHEALYADYWINKIKHHAA